MNSLSIGIAANAVPPPTTEKVDTMDETTNIARLGTATFTGAWPAGNAAGPGTAMWSGADTGGDTGAVSWVYTGTIIDRIPSEEGWVYAGTVVTRIPEAA